MFVQCPKGPEDSVRPSETGDTGGCCVHSVGAGNQTPGPLGEQPVLLTTGPSLVPFAIILALEKSIIQSFLSQLALTKVYIWKCSLKVSWWIIFQYCQMVILEIKAEQRKKFCCRLTKHDL